LAAKIVFLTLSVANKLRIVCDLIEKEFLNGKKIIVNTVDEDEGNSLDRLLWTWKQSSFIPHSFIPQLTASADDPVIITTNLNIDLKYDTLILLNPTSFDIFDWFSTVIDFAEKYNQTKLVADRERYKEYRDKKFNIETFNPGEYIGQASK